MLLLADAWGMQGDVVAVWAIVMMTGMAVFWAAIVLAVVWIVRSGLERSSEKREKTPLEILDRRFAEGAISLDEYRQRRAELLGNKAPRAKGAASTL